MNINSIKYFSIQKPVIQKRAFLNSFKGNNLAPLPFDTVSFGISRNEEKLNRCSIGISVTPEKQTSLSEDKKLNQNERGSRKVAQDLYDDSEYAYKQLRFIIGQTFNTQVIDSQSPDFEEKFYRAIQANRDKKVVAILARRKSPNSISEKMSSSHCRSKAATKEKLNDIIGVKIIVSGNTPESGNYVMTKLTEAVKKGRLKIKTVKTHGQEDRSLRYADKSKIDKLVEVSRKNGEPLCTYVDQPRDSGYTAIHLITGDIDDGFNGEIQIMGYDVEKFKELEDLCYKCHAGKKIPKKYKELETLFKPMQQNPTLKADFLEYTKRAYAYERLKNDPSLFKNTEFLKIPSDLNIPKELDFNNIYNLVKQLNSHAQIKEIAKANQESMSSALNTMLLD